MIDLLFLQARSHGTTVTVAASSFLDASNEFYGNKCVCCVSDFYCGTDLNDKVIFDAVTDAPCEWTLSCYFRAINYLLYSEMHSTTTFKWNNSNFTLLRFLRLVAG